MRRARRDFNEARDQITKSIIGHRARGRKSISVDFRTQGKGSNYAFALTWTPGTLMLSGDLGELTLTHYHAMPTWEEALAWVHRADYDYLLGKSDKRREYDRDATADYLIQDANGVAIQELKRLRDELREWRRCDPRKITTGDPDDLPTVDEWLADKPKAEQSHYTLPRGLVVPEPWQPWDGLREAFTFNEPPQGIYTPGGRREIKRELRDWLYGNTRDALVDALHRLGYDDYYGDEAWTFHTLQQVAAIQFGVETILNGGAHPSDPYGWDQHYNPFPPESVFIDWMAKHYRVKTGMSWEKCHEHAVQTLAESLPDMVPPLKIEYGDPNVTWDQMTARMLVDEEMEHWETVDA